MAEPQPPAVAPSDTQTAVPVSRRPSIVQAVRRLSVSHAQVDAGYLDLADDRDSAGSIYISYSRTDVRFVQALNDALNNGGLNKEIVIDWEERSDLRELYKTIELADVFLFVISPDSIKSQACHLEIGHAVAMGKRIVPVVCVEVELSQVGPGLASLEWIFFPPLDSAVPNAADGSDAHEDPWADALRLLIKTITKDFRHARMHTKILVRALAYESGDYEESLLLRGRDAHLAQQWLFESALGTLPRPTMVHLSLITDSLGIITTINLQCETVEAASAAADKKEALPPASAFICFSRDDKAFVESLVKDITGNKRKVAVDYKPIPDPPSPAWLKESHQNIQKSDVFIFVMSPRSNVIEALHWEIDHALKLGKRIIAVVKEDVDLLEVRGELAALYTKWIFARPSDDLGAAMRLLQVQMDTDLKHLMQHTELVQAAMKWENKDRDKGALVRKQEFIQRASDWLLWSALGKEPRPSKLLLDFLTESQREAEKCVLL